MSVIENALSRSREQRPADESAARRTSAQPVGPAPPPLQLQKLVLDPVVLERNRVLPQVTDRSALRAYKILRTRLLQRLAANKWRSVAVTSTKSGEGKTLTTINLAVALSQEPNTRVCLVDFDLQRPAVAAQLGIRVERGLGEYLLGEAEAEQVIYECGIPRLVVIPNNRTFDHSSEMLASARAQELMRLLSTHLPDHIVVFDMPPLSSDDVLTFAPRVDGVLLVVAEGRTERAALEKTKELLAEMNILGVVLNHSAERDDGLDYY
jgi:capsular exopolysaccharide synthesis family protein